MVHTYNIVLNQYTVWEDVRDIIVGDLDRDGKQEIIAASGWRIVVFENTANNEYELVWNSGNEIPVSMGVALNDAEQHARVTELARGEDLDEDGNLEIVAASHAWMFIYENNGNDSYNLIWKWKHDPHVVRFEPEIYDLHFTDADKDGLSEIIVVGTDEQRDQWGTLYNRFGWFLIWEVSENATSGQPLDNSYDMVFDQQLSIQGVSAFSVDVADHDHNGKSELFLGIGSGVNIWICVNDNLYAEIALLPTEFEATNVLSENTDGDTFLEIVVSQGKRLSVFEQNWTYPLSWFYYDNVWNSTDLPTSVTDIVVGDSNNNTLQEILATTAEGYVYSYEWITNSTLDEGGSTLLASEECTSLDDTSSGYMSPLSVAVLIISERKRGLKPGTHCDFYRRYVL
jgi:hypothetical protein